VAENPELLEFAHALAPPSPRAARPTVVAYPMPSRCSMWDWIASGLPANIT
jgi:hypothetical protein